MAKQSKSTAVKSNGSKTETDSVHSKNSSKIISNQLQETDVCQKPFLIEKVWGNLQFNEWTFTLILFLFSLSILVAKIINNYDTLVIYAENFYHFISPLHAYLWAVKAVSSGIGVTSLTWFIVYKDSYIPGVEPPSPFSSKNRHFMNSDSSIMQLNYLIGLLNGFLIFLYMCF